MTRQLEPALGPGTNPADEHRDPAVVARVTATAGEILARHGVDIRTARRAGGWSNLTWLAGGLAIRVAAAPGSGDLLREAQLAALLPPEVGYPRIVDSGVAAGHEWMLAEEAPGTNLGRAWPDRGWDERARALVELWEKAEAVHTVDRAEAERHARPDSPFYAGSRPAADTQVRQLEARSVLAPAQSAVLRATLDRFWKTLSTGRPVLNHGDLCIENALWHRGHVSCLLDFEFAVIAPVELDANEMLREVYAPREEPDHLPDPDGSGRRRLQAAVTRAVLPALREPGAADRLLGYAVLLQLWSMNGWLAHWDGWEDFTTWQPYRALTALAAGDSGYLASVLSRLP
ncbi:MAG: aminoglycoside phosphotransferase family protein [Chloroflexi bacterium]|nr:aminoglycoside phosphotransferase family protein [Chloroflexota bacterium]